MFVPEPERPLSPARTSVRPAPAAPYGLAPYGICRQFPHPLHSINPTDSPRHASRPWRLSFLVQFCVRAGKTVISRSNLSASGSCRALQACLLWHLPSVSASASRTRKPPSNTIGQHTFARLGLITSAPSSPARRQCITDIFILKVYDGTHVILLLCFLCV